MTGRPTMPIGSHGRIAIRPLKVGYEASCRHRDPDGVTRRVSAVGPTRGTAERNLQSSLLRRDTGRSNDLTSDSRLELAAQQWFDGVQNALQSGEVSPSTVRLYRGVLAAHVLPALGALKLREVTTARVGRFLVAVRDRSGPGSAKTCRTVLSGILKHAVRCDAIPHNTVRDAARLPSKPRKQPRALTREERVRWLAQLAADSRSVNKDLPDLVTFMLDTGVRIGEALAVAWDEIDLDGARVAIEYTLVRIKGQGLVRKSTKTTAGLRVLPLPASTVAMLRKRRRAGRIGTTPVFPDSRGGWRDPYNTQRDIRNARGTEEFSWITSHVFRKSAATWLDEAGFSARDIANHMGHSKVSMTQDVYLGRGVANPRAAEALGDGTSRA